MFRAAGEGFINATDLADYLTKRGVPFRTAYKLVGSIVERCSKEGRILDSLPLQTYREYSEVFSEDLFDEISLQTCVAKRISEGGTGPDSVALQINNNRIYIERN